MNNFNVDFLPLKDCDLFVNHLSSVISGDITPDERIMKMYPAAAYTIKQEFEIDPSKTTQNVAALREYAKLYLRAWDIFNGLGLPDMPEPDRFLSNEIERIREQVVEKDKAGEVVRVRFQRLADIISKRLRFAYLSKFGEFLLYDSKNGTWRDGAEDKIASVVKEILGDACTVHYITEITTLIRVGSLTSLDEFGKVPDGLINMQNGVFDWKNHKLIPHSPEYHFRWVLPFRYNRHVRRSRFFKVLEEIFADDLRKALSTMEVFAWIFIPGYPIQKAVTFFGTGNNGKSTIMDVLSEFIGRENTSSTPLQTLCMNRFAIPGLRGKLGNIAGDVSDATLLDTGVFKNLTGDRYVEGEIKGLQNRPLFPNTAKMLFGFNRLPFSRDNSVAYYRRFFLIECVQSFEGKAVKDLVSKITGESDLQDIFNVVTNIFLPVLAKNMEFTFSEKAETVMERYNLNSNPALAYINEQLEPEPNGIMPSNALYSDFVRWCETRGISPVASHSFGLTLTRYSGLDVHHKQKQEDGVRNYYYIGIRKKQPDENETDGGNSDYNIGDMNKSTYATISSLRTFADAVEYYVHEYLGGGGAYSSYAFQYLRNSSKVNYISKEKAYALQAAPHDDHLQTSENTGSKSPAYAFEKKPDSLSSFDPETTFEAPKKSEDSQPEPTESDVQSEKPEKKPFSISDGDMIKDQLLAMGYLLDPSQTGLSIFGQKYTLSIRTPKHESMEKLLYIMSKSGFEQQNTGAMGYLFFSKDVIP